MVGRRTKILATLGPATDQPGVIDELVRGGLDGARINTAHGEPADWRRQAAALRAASDAAARVVALLVDISGPKLRLLDDVLPREVLVGESVTFVGAESSPDGALGVAWPELIDAVIPGVSEIVIGDGAPRFSVVTTFEGEVRCTCIRKGPVEPRKGIFVTHSRVELPAMGGKEVEHAEIAAELEADFIALSFVRSGQDIRRLRSILEAVGSTARVIAKIEQLSAFDALDDILAVSDGVMVARGDLGVQAGVARVPILQKEIIHRAVGDGKLAITATQMLESMISSPAPTRAEATDVANAILDGTSTLMLSAETAVGEHPVEVVRVMGEIAVHAQSEPVYQQDIEAPVESRAEAIMQSAVLLARQVGAAAIVVPTTSGGSARAAIKYRPQLPLVALCRDVSVARQLALDWGVIPALLEGDAESAEEFVELMVSGAIQVAGLRPGDTVVVAYGSTLDRPGSTNVIVLRQIATVAPVRD
ncbi:MAG: pyruvate kinase [Miltoncostaeaceae bacterium]